MFTLILAIALLGLGFLGCFIAKVPGPLFAWLGLVTMYHTSGLLVEWWVIWIVLPIIVLASMFFTSKIAPKIAAKAHEFGKAGKWGTFVGSVLAFLLATNGYVMMVMLLLLPYIFAFIFEFVSVKNMTEALKRAGGSYVLFIMTSLVKLIVVFVCLAFAFPNYFSF